MSDWKHWPQTVGPCEQHTIVLRWRSVQEHKRPCSSTPEERIKGLQIYSPRNYVSLLSDTIGSVCRTTGRKKECWGKLPKDLSNEPQPGSMEAPLRHHPQCEIHHIQGHFIFYLNRSERIDKQKIYECADATLKLPLCKHTTPKTFLTLINHLSQMPI